MLWDLIDQHPLDTLAFLVFLSFTIGYHMLYNYLVRRRPELIFKGKINLIRRAWVQKIFDENTGIVGVQTLRNINMAASFLATASVVLIGGLISLLLNLESTQHLFIGPGTGQVRDWLLAIKLLTLIVLFAASLFYFSLCVRLLNHVGMLLGAPPEAIRQATGYDATDFVYNLYAIAGRHYTFGMRSFYFLIPAVLWFLGPTPCILATVSVGFILMKLDFGTARFK
ncbi:MAG: DUF599 domain-containing protein [Nitrospirota bacterium]|nr:DUF599 domain-containing protein [Nitrospirota bacterium]